MNMLCNFLQGFGLQIYNFLQGFGGLFCNFFPIGCGRGSLWYAL